MNISISEIFLFLLVPVFAVATIFISQPDISTYDVLSYVIAEFRISYLSTALTLLLPILVAQACFKASIDHHGYAAIAAGLAGVLVFVMTAVVAPPETDRLIACAFMGVVVFLASLDFMKSHIWGHVAVISVLLAMNTDTIGWVQRIASAIL